MAADLCPWEAGHLVAAATGDVAKLQEELEKRADVDCPDHEYERTALFWAADRGYEDAVQLLISHGADVNFFEPNHGRTPLLAAIANGHEAVARHLIQSGARVDTGDTSRETPLIVAARDGHVSLVSLLLGAGVDVDAKEGHGDRTALSLAAANGHRDIVELLLQNNATPRLADCTGRKPLAWAIEQGHNEIVLILLNRDADAAPTDTDTLPYVVEHGLKNETLFSAFVNLVNVPDGERLDWALERGYSSVVKQLLEQGADPEHKNNTGKTPLIVAAEEGYFGLVELLLEMNVEVESRDEEGRTPLSYAAEKGHAEIVTLLLDKGADLHSEDDQEMTPLTVAALRGYESIVSLLLERGADADHWDNGGFSPLVHAALDGHAGVVSMLLERGVDPNTRDKEEDKSVMTWAASGGHSAVVQLLLAKNVSPNDEDTDQTPLAGALDNSIDSQDYSIVKMLLQHGAQPFSEVYRDNVPPLVVAVSNGLDELVALFLKVDPASNEDKQEHVKKAICEAVEWEKESLLDLLFEHYAPVDLDAETPLDWAREEYCGSKQAVRLLSKYFPEHANAIDSED
ncbi:hypothetical protein SCARD494_01820 [Seiridium cardinale]